MVGVSETVLSRKTKFPNIIAELDDDWESKYGATISFILLDLSTEEMRVAKQYHPRGFKWKYGDYGNKEVIREYGQEFRKWVAKINKQKCVTIAGKKICRRRGEKK